MVNWTSYLESICTDDTYKDWQEFYTPTDALDSQRAELKKFRSRLNLRLIAQTTQPHQPEEEAPEKIERLSVLEGVRKYAANHVLLVGKPGSGKSTALERLLWEEANTAKTDPQTKIPVLVKLRRYEASVLGIIQDFLIGHGLSLNEPDIENLLFEGRFLLLVDGLNELPNEDARRDLDRLRQKYHRSTPMIFTTRDLGGDLGIEKKLEMQPLTEVQMQQFVRAYLTEQGNEFLRQLGGRLRELGQTPLLLWMLCEVFREARQVLANLGELFRWFSREYVQLKRDVPISEGLQGWQSELLQYLAFVMMQDKSPTELGLTISKQQARSVFTEFLQGKIAYPDNFAIRWLEDLLKYHLIQLGAEDKIEFRHQLIQEYYTAESLLKQLPQLSDDGLKREYLNYLKWTEPLVLMLELVNESTQALRVVKIALEVDLRLGARLAGAVKPEFQAQMVALVNEIEISRKIKTELLGITRSEQAIPALLQALNHTDSYVRARAVDALGKIGTEAAVSALLQALNHTDSYVRARAVDALGKIGTEAAVPALLQALSDANSYVRARAVDALGKIGTEAAVPALLQALSDANSYVRARAVDALETIATAKVLPGLLELLRTTAASNVLDIIAAIQARYQFYNDTLIPPAQPISIPLMYILHLSDLHFGTSNNAHNWYNQLAEDLYQELNCPRLNALILSGDIANQSTLEEYTAAELFLNNLCQEFQLQPEQIVIVPGNHDLNWGLAEDAYTPVRRRNYRGQLDNNYIIDNGEYIEVQDQENYKQRFKYFSNFYQSVKGEPYPLEYEQQGILHHLPEQNLLILGLNSAWQLDHHYKSRASINADALNQALTDIRQNQAYKDCLKIAVWHHPLNSAFEDRITDHGFMEQLAKAGFRSALHGHIHKAETSLYSYDLSAGGRKLNIICAGTFGAPIREWVPGYPLQYNLLKLEDNKLTVETRRREEPNGAWKPDARWLQGAGRDPLPRYAIEL